MISVIVPTMNEGEHIGGCLASLANQSLDRSEFEIIIVDGNSEDETREIAHEYADKVIIQQHRGIGGARKDGVEASSGDLLVWTDADTLHNSNWLALIRANLCENGYDVCTGPILFYERTLRSELLSLWRKQYNLFHLFNFYWLIGSNMAMKRDIYEKINGHRDISLLEDYDISVRMFRKGSIRCRYDSRQEVYTSARRLTNLVTYLMVYLYGHYHYHVTRDYQRLLKYPHFDKMDLEVMLEVAGLKDVNRKLGEMQGRIVKNFDKFEEKLNGKS
jgi:glycosyltransferase involved in cell wall biosynthesis